MDLFINEFYVTTSSDLIVSLQLNSTTNKYGISNLTNTDIGFSIISLNLTWNWLLEIDINNDPNLLTNMAYNNNFYILLEKQALNGYTYLHLTLTLKQPRI